MILAQYLGKDHMLPIVSRSFEAAGAFEDFVESDYGEVDCIHPLCEPAVNQLCFTVLHMVDLLFYVWKISSNIKHFLITIVLGSRGLKNAL
ncbi:hypothetical protein RchiOBHm_Chr2g0148041 [Rosa chinensis]|uniref:Uncharacterized protein n=1 Tax=Rosa chinensis TaxID=74649 RepID=A0A2P6RZB1_ROSCH|nr:hypothetical protein RchiOBHm_Chr2g0148041 [Rosa chinensis]